MIDHGAESFAVKNSAPVKRTIYSSEYGPMVDNLVKAGYSVRGFDVSEEARRAVQGSGTTIVGAVTAGAPP